MKEYYKKLLAYYKKCKLEHGDAGYHWDDDIKRVEEMINSFDE